jgi:hypothetical protein
LRLLKWYTFYNKTVIYRFNRVNPELKRLNNLVSNKNRNQIFLYRPLSTLIKPIFWIGISFFLISNIYCLSLAHFINILCDKITQLFFLIHKNLIKNFLKKNLIITYLFDINSFQIKAIIVKRIQNSIQCKRKFIFVWL